MIPLPWHHTPALAGSLMVYHFPSTSVRVAWEDGSRAEWKDAFWQKEGDFTVVYTEHCLYHVLLLHDDDVVEGQEGPCPLTPEQQRECDQSRSLS